MARRSYQKIDLRVINNLRKKQNSEIHKIDNDLPGLLLKKTSFILLKEMLSTCQMMNVYLKIQRASRYKRLVPS